MKCRTRCGTCCIVPSFTSVIPGMQSGKPAEVPSIHLTSDDHCSIYKSQDRPEVCIEFRADTEICGVSRTEAFSIMAGLEGIILEDPGID